jgi:uncharacterized protein YkwD/uncharacterized membrane protein required for colicin V production
VNRVDAVLLLILALYGFGGYRRGFMAVVLDWLGLAAAVVLALWLAPVSGDWLAHRYVLWPVLARLISFLGLLLIARLVWAIGVSLLLPRIPRVLRRSRLDRFAGIVPGLLQGAIVASLLLLAVAAVPLPIVPHAEIAASPMGSALLRWGTGVQAAAQAWMGQTVHDLITFRTAPAKEGERIDLPFKEAHPTPDPEAEAAVLHLVNVERRRRRLAPLSMDVRLSGLARQHSADMLVRGYFGHVDLQGRSPFARMHASGLQFHAAGENVAFAPSVATAHTGLMNSPGHRANILNPTFHRVGIGAMKAPPFGVMFSQEFKD